jgi:hypothetical protein
MPLQGKFGTIEMKIWISYTKSDKDFFERISREIEHDGHEIISIENEISAGDFIVDKLTAQINQADFILLILSKDSIKSSWINYEILIALSERGRRKTIIPLLLTKGIAIPPIISHLFYLDFTDNSNFDESKKKLLDAIRHKESERTARHSNKNLETLIKERTKQLLLEREIYEKQKFKQYDIGKLYKFSLVLTMIASIIGSIISFRFIIQDKSNEIISQFTYVNIVFYLLGILTAIIPSIYFVLKHKKG